MCSAQSLSTNLSTAIAHIKKISIIDRAAGKRLGQRNRPHAATGTKTASKETNFFGSDSFSAVMPGLAYGCHAKLLGRKNVKEYEYPDAPPSVSTLLDKRAEMFTQKKFRHSQSRIQPQRIDGKKDQQEKQLTVPESGSEEGTFKQA